MDWVKDMFNTKWPVIGMAHVPALPGTPRYDRESGMKGLIEQVRQDVEVLEIGGVNAIMFCNEDDRPYVFNAGVEQVAAMSRVIAETAPSTIPFGVDFLWDPLAAISIAHATSAYFVREVFTGLYESDMGVWSPSAGNAARLQSNIGAENIRVFFNIVPEFASSIGSRTAAERARSAVVSSLADLILVSGPMAGQEPSREIFQDIKEAVGDTPVFLNTGASIDNIEHFYDFVDGVIVGSNLKVDGYTWNCVDPQRVKTFMQKVKQIGK
jgi:membrane complex biogenesis BtpA family protein